MGEDFGYVHGVHVAGIYSDRDQSDDVKYNIGVLLRDHHHFDNVVE